MYFGSACRVIDCLESGYLRKRKRVTCDVEIKRVTCNVEIKRVTCC